ncbi:MAG: hypothetical protein ACTSX8_03450 [Alphaproteobacteria bacterium]
MQLYLYDAAKRRLTGWGFAGWSELSRANSTDGRWVAIRRIFHAPPHTAFARIALGAADNGAVYFDDISIEPIASPFPLPPRTISKPRHTDSNQPLWHDGRWSYKGRPFMPVGFWAVPWDYWKGSRIGLRPEDVRQLRNLRLNAIVLCVRLEWFKHRPEMVTTVRRILDAAERAGMWIVLQPAGAGREGVWPEKTVAALYREFGRSNALIGWMLLDDAVSDPNVVLAVHRNASALRKYDHTRPIFVDLWDIRGAKLRPNVDPSVWRDWLDGAFTYWYPVHGGGRLDGVQRVIDLVRDRSGYRPHFVVQAFTHDWHRRLGLARMGWNDHPLPTPDQLRLMTYYALQRRVPGLFFFVQHTCTQAMQGKDRLCEIGILATEITLFADFVTSPETPKELSTNRSDVQAVALTRGRDHLVVLTRHDDGFTWCISTRPTSVTISLPARMLGQHAHLLRLTWPEPRLLHTKATPQGYNLELHDFDLTDLILVTRDIDRLEKTRRAIARLSPGVMRLRAERARALAAKVEAVWKRIAPAMDEETASLHSRARENPRLLRALIARCVAQAHRHWRDQAHPVHAYHAALRWLATRKLISDRTATQLGCFVEKRVPRSVLRRMDCDNFLAAHFFLLPCFYGALTDDDTLAALCQEVRTSLAKQNRAPDELLSRLARREFNKVVTP